MSLGEQIHRLRTHRSMSQEELADRLGVSRQSVSKWETDVAVPELDKLMRMGDLFGVSLDELTGREPAPAHPDTAAVPTPGPAPQSHFASQRIVGAVLLVISLLGGFLLLELLPEPDLAIVFSVPTLLCGISCITLRRHAGYACGWAWYAFIDAGIAFARHSIPGINTFVYAVIKTLVFAGMVVATFRCFRDTPVRLTRGRVALLAGGWGAWLLTTGWVVTGLVESTRPILDRNDIATRPNYALLMIVSNLLAAPLALLIFFSVRLYKERRKRK